jgi:hypothetical protein
MPGSGGLTTNVLDFRLMRNFLLTASGFILLCAASPAFAQMSPGGGAPGLGGAGGAPTAPQPQARIPDIAPPALPGAGDTPVATGPVVQKPPSGDPTPALFAAVNRGDYNAAQDAISRGANLDAQNPLGETPLDLSVALNRSSITFLLLATRNETGGDDAAPGPAAASPGTSPGTGRTGHNTPHPHIAQIVPAADSTPLHKIAPPLGTDPGTPNPSAGFLGFGPKS